MRGAITEARRKMRKNPSMIGEFFGEFRSKLHGKDRPYPEASARVAQNFLNLLQTSLSNFFVTDILYFVVINCYCNLTSRCNRGGGMISKERRYAKLIHPFFGQVLGAVAVRVRYS